ncbi:MAG: hypothetical protein R2856_23180 [Caldilineaceae bacterium]
MKTITADFICTDTNGELDFYDLHTFQPLGDRSDDLPIAPTLPYSGSRHDHPPGPRTTLRFSAARSIF